MINHKNSNLDHQGATSTIQSTLLDQITPVILTYNEAPNIKRSLEKLVWARDIVVVDSFSTDETVEIIKIFPQARIYQRTFDAHFKQWNFAIQETNIRSEWILALDADFLLTDEMIRELKSLKPEPDVNGYWAKFFYCVYGRPLHASVYPPVAVLYRKVFAEYEQDGHTERVRIRGKVANLKSLILHDDRKRLSRWFSSQHAYAKLEADKILTLDFKNLNWPDRLRKTRFLAPFAIFLYCLSVQGLFLDGLIGFFYSFQRMAAEFILSSYLIDHDLKATTTKESSGI